jgi:hypothetical protein
VALLAFLVVFGGLGLGVWAFAPGGTGTQAISSIDAGQRALEVIRGNLNQVTGPGIDLIEAEPEHASELLTEAYEQLSVASRNGIQAATIEPLREQTIEGLDRLSGVVPVSSTDLYTFKPKEGKPPIDLKAAVRGPDGATFVLDASTKTVWRVDLKNKKADGRRQVGPEGAWRNRRHATPHRRRWARPARARFEERAVALARCQQGRQGHRYEDQVQGASSWGDDILSIGTFVRIASEGLYNLYVVDPSEQQIKAYSPARDGSGFPGKHTNWLATDRATDTMSALHIDGDCSPSRTARSRASCRARTTAGRAPCPTTRCCGLRPATPSWQGAGERREGVVYWLRPAQRAADRDQQGRRPLHRPVPPRRRRRTAGRTCAASTSRRPGEDPEAPPVIVWVSRDGVHQATLEAVTNEPGRRPAHPRVHPQLRPPRPSGAERA